MIHIANNKLDFAENLVRYILTAMLLLIEILESTVLSNGVQGKALFNYYVLMFCSLAPPPFFSSYECMHS